MRTWIIIGIVLIIILIIVFKSLNNSKNNSNIASPVQHSAYKRVGIEECIAAQDVQYALKESEQEIVNEIKRSQGEISNAVQSSNRKINISWINSYEKVLRTANTLNENLKYNQKKNMEKSNFHYYTNLHFRSMLAANIVCNEYKEIKESFDEMNKLIVTLKKSNFRGVSKKDIYNTKDQFKALKGIFYNKLEALNSNTGQIRDKIGRECGERGQKWWHERKSRKA